MKIIKNILHGLLLGLITIQSGSALSAEAMFVTKNFNNRFKQAIQSKWFKIGCILIGGSSAISFAYYFSNKGMKRGTEILQMSPCPLNVPWEVATPCRLITPFESAIENGKISEVNYLLENGTDPNQIIQEKRAIDFAIEKFLKAPEWWPYFMSHQLDHPFNPKHKIFKGNYREIIRMLVDKGGISEDYTSEKLEWEIFMVSK